MTYKKIYILPSIILILSALLVSCSTDDDSVASSDPYDISGNWYKRGEGSYTEDDDSTIYDDNIVTPGLSRYTISKVAENEYKVQGTMFYPKRRDGQTTAEYDAMIHNHTWTEADSIWTEYSPNYWIIKGNALTLKTSSYTFNDYNIIYQGYNQFTISTLVHISYDVSGSDDIEKMFYTTFCRR